MKLPCMMSDGRVAGGAPADIGAAAHRAGVRRVAAARRAGRGGRSRGAGPRSANWILRRRQRGGAEAAHQNHRQVRRAAGEGLVC
jgi:hypothetical protein